MGFLNKLALLGCCAGALGCSEKPEGVAQIFFGGDILTMQGDRPQYVQALAINDGKITYAGQLNEALELAGANTIKSDLEGQTLMPSFIDAHGHFMSSLEMVKQVNLANPPVGSVSKIPHIIEKLKAYQEHHQVPKGGWILGWGYDKEGLDEQRDITKLDLDPHFPDHKVMVIHVSMHGAVLNSQALKWANITADTPTPEGSVLARLPNSQEPAGLIMEGAYLPVYLKRPMPDAEEMMDIIARAQAMYSSEGYTHAQDGFTSIKNMDFLKKAAAQNKLVLDVVSLPGFNQFEEWVNNPNYPFGKYNQGLKFQGIKITQDGSPQAKTAHVSEPYLTGGLHGEADWQGETTLPKDHFSAVVKKAVDADLQLFIHANGDATIDQTIEAVRTAGVTSKDDRRSVVIHSQFQRPDHLEHYKELGISPSYFSNHAFFWGDVHAKNIGWKKASFISPIKAAKQKGLVYSNHTDFNVTPLDPFFVMWTAMKRETRAGKILGPDQTVDAYTALQGLTTGPAWQVFEEHRKGMLKEGMLADLIILSANPLKTSVDDIRNIKVQNTIKEGISIYQAP